MKHRFTTLIVALLLTLPATAAEWEGKVALELRGFSSPPANEGQHEDNLSLSFEPEFYHAWDEADMSFTFAPFIRIDQHDGNRTHFDIRELFWQKSAENWDLRIGVRKVYWGVTESQHLVDIINQTDLVENPDTEDKLGQLMLNFAWINDWGTIDFFVLPHFRERTFPGKKGRFSAPFTVDDDNPIYESSRKEWHTDFAVRYKHYVGDWDIGLSHFYGTSREPRLVPRLDDFTIELAPYYDIIHQTGVDLQWTHEAWLLKFEGIHRRGMGDNYTAVTTGFEYTFFDAFEKGWDIGVLLEYLWDSRGDDALTPFENDIFAGTRLSFNDVQSTNVLAGVIIDPESGALAIGIEADRRLGDNWKLAIESRIFTGVPPDDLGDAFRKDDFVQLELSWYF